MIPHQLPCIITAGGIPTPRDPLFALTNGRPKAMLDMHGRPMLQWVLDGVQGAACVGEVVVVGLDDAADRDALRPQRPVHHLPNQRSLVGNVQVGLQWVRQNLPEAQMALLCSADIPHLQSFMVDELVAECAPFDKLFYYTIAERKIIEAQYPNSGRTFTKLRNAEFAGGDLFVVQLKVLEKTQPAFWESLTNARKRPWQMAKLVGLGTLWRLLTRQLTVGEAAELAGRMMGADGPIGVIFLRHAAVAMDADKPAQVVLLRQKRPMRPE